MKKLTRNRWIAVCAAVVVGIIFYATGTFGFFNNQGAVNLDNFQAMDSTSNTSFSSSVAGFEIQDIVVGTGAEAKAGKILSVHYTGALTDGRVFDSSVNRGKPFEFTLGAGQVIAGWEKGFTGMKVGGKRRLVIPSDYAYGTKGVSGLIPPNSALIFEVNLLDVK